MQMFWREFYGLALTSVPPVAPAVNEAVISYRVANEFAYSLNFLINEMVEFFRFWSFSSDLYGWYT